MMLKTPRRREYDMKDELEMRGLIGIANEVVARHRGVTLVDVLSPNRSADVVEARAHLVYELYDEVRSYPRVGRLLGIHHTTAMAARKRWAVIVGDVAALRPQAQVLEAAE
jgi:chromosomal replication initiation ATPase DnaA